LLRGGLFSGTIIAVTDVMKIILFSLYYLKLRLTLLFGIHRTANPIDIKWRYRYWINKNETRLRHRIQKQQPSKN
jgi:hypothetical protein